MHERGLCRYAVSFRLSVRLSVTFVDHVKTNKRIFEIFSPSGNHTILGFPYLTAWRYSDGNPPNGGVECRWRRQKTQFWTNIWLYWTCVYWCLQRIYRVTLIGVFLGHFRINLHQTRTQYSDEGPKHWNATHFKKRFLNVEFGRRIIVVLTFLRCVSSKFELQQNLNKLTEWASDWQLPISYTGTKCCVLNIGKRAGSPDIILYTFDDRTMEQTEEVLDLCVTINNRLNFSKHIAKIVTKAHRRANLIIRYVSRYVVSSESF